MSAPRGDTAPSSWKQTDLLCCEAPCAAVANIPQGSWTRRQQTHPSFMLWGYWGERWVCNGANLLWALGLILLWDAPAKNQPGCWDLLLNLHCTAPGKTPLGDALQAALPDSVCSTPTHEADDAAFSGPQQPHYSKPAVRWEIAPQPTKLWKADLNKRLFSPLLVSFKWQTR